MIYAYPCELAADDQGALVATFPDVPEAITGAHDRTEALHLAADALAAALAGYVHNGRDIPEPSEPADCQELVAVDVVTAAKLALYSAMRAQGISETELARRLGASTSAVRKLADPDRSSRIRQLNTALKAAGCRLAVELTPG